MLQRLSISKVSLILFPLIGCLAVWGIALLLIPHTTLSTQNIIFIFFACPIFLFSLVVEKKNLFDWLIISILAVNLFGGPLKALFYNYTFYSAYNLIYFCLLIAYSWLIVQKIFNIARWIIPAILSVVFITKATCVLILSKYPSEWLLRYSNGEIVFDFFTFESFLNTDLQSLLGLIPAFILVNYIFIKNRSVYFIPIRNLLVFAGVFVFFLLYLARGLFEYEGYMSPWLHSTLEVFVIAQLLVWFIALRTGDRLDKREDRQVLWGIHLAMLFPILYFLFYLPGKKSILVTVCMVAFIETLVFLFNGLIQQRYRILEIGQDYHRLVERLSVLWHQEADGIVITDDDGNIIKASDRIAELRGETMVGQNLRSMLEMKESPVTGFQLERAGSEGWLVSKDGDRHPVMLTTEAIHSVHNHLMFSIISDTEKRMRIIRTSQEMQQRSQELKTMESLYRMSADISHNFNNFLNSMGGYIELVRLSLDDPAKATHYLGILDDQVTRSAAYVKKVIGITTAEAAQYEDVDLETAINDGIEELKTVEPDLDWKYRIKVKLPDELPPVIGVKDDVADIVFQLVRNSIEAMPGGGVITVSAQSVHFLDTAEPRHGLDPGSYVEVSVCDTGTGIDPSIERFVFNPFFSTRQTVARGLGLAIVDNLIRRFKGAITFRNNPVRGTTFTVYLKSAIQK
jgi:signal transduction histidine kinase